MSRVDLRLLLLIACFLPVQLSAGTPVSGLRRPIDIVLSPRGDRVLVANRRSGSVSVIDRRGRGVIFECRVGRTLSALAVVPGTGMVLATDESAHELVGLEHGDGDRRLLRVAWRLPVASYPVAVSVTPDGRRAIVASLWSRRLTLVRLAGSQRPRPEAVRDLPFAPRRLLQLPGGRWLVAAAFGGRVAVVGRRLAGPIAVRLLEAHNVGRMAISPDRRHVLIPHQLMAAEEATTEGGVHWGGVMLNVVRTVSIAAIEAGTADLGSRRGLDYVGVPDRAAGDPVALCLGAKGLRVLLLAGVHEVVTSEDGIGYFTRQRLGLGPTAVVLEPDGARAWVANRFDDSVSLVQLSPLAVLAKIPLGMTARRTAVDRGEELFHDARLSSDGWFSCRSCHTRGHTNGGLNDNFGDDSYGAPKKVSSLLGTRDTGPWAWNGEVPRLVEQVKKSVRLTMRGPRLGSRQANDLATYLKSLPAAPSLAEARGTIDTEVVNRGRAVFARARCGSCHAAPAYTSPRNYDVGLEDELGRTRFNPPSLRGVSQHRRLFHDNRAGSLGEVLGRFRHGLESPLSDGDRRDLLRFLESL